MASSDSSSEESYPSEYSLLEDEDDLMCKYCKHQFVTQRTLKIHQTTAKYCLKIQGVKLSATNVCDHCKAVFSQVASLGRHTIVCKKKLRQEGQMYKDVVARLEEEVDGYKDTIKILKTQIQDLQQTISEQTSRINKLERSVSHGEGEIKGIKETKRATTINNNYINPKLANIPIEHVRPFTIENVSDDIDEGKYTYDLFLKGERGFMVFLLEIIELDGGSGLIERSYACTDTSRDRFHRLCESRSWIKDYGAVFLHKVLDELQVLVEKYLKLLIKKELNAAPGEDKDEYTYFLDQVRPFAHGVLSNGQDREELVERLCTKLRKTAAV